MRRDEITPAQFEVAKKRAQDLTHALGDGSFLDNGLAISLFLAAQLRGQTLDPEASRIGLHAIHATAREFLDEMWSKGLPQ